MIQNKKRLFLEDAHLLHTLLSKDPIKEFPLYVKFMIMYNFTIHYPFSDVNFSSMNSTEFSMH